MAAPELACLACTFFGNRTGSQRVSAKTANRQTLCPHQWAKKRRPASPHTTSPQPKKSLTSPKRQRRIRCFTDCNGQHPRSRVGLVSSRPTGQGDVRRRRDLSDRWCSAGVSRLTLCVFSARVATELRNRKAESTL